MNYKCPVCGMESDKAGECEVCQVQLEEVCENCGEIETNCSCVDRIKLRGGKRT